MSHDLEKSILTLLAIGIVVSGAQSVFNNAPEPRLKEDNIQYQVNLNTAPHWELDALPKIGPSRATRIIEHRTVHGMFDTVDDLLNLDDSIRAADIEILRPYVKLAE